LSQIAIEKITDGSPKTLSFFSDIAKQSEAIERRAFDLFEKRGKELGHELEDWLKAERDVVLSPLSELVDEGKVFKARIALPGFDAKDVQVSAMKDAIVVKADTTHTHEQKDGNVCFCEFSRTTCSVVWHFLPRSMSVKCQPRWRTAFCR
jgi:HSP20 family molecular chaperone IbpA